MILAEGLEARTVYWMDGSAPKGSASHALGFEAKQPPNLGWSTALVLAGTGKLVTLFCPYSFQSYQVRPSAGELRCSREPTELRREWLSAHLKRKWAEFQSYGYQRDYDTAALVFKRLGEAVPEQIMRGGEEDTRMKGGKEVGKKLERPVKADGKRGKFLRWFLDGGGSRSVREAMAEFGMSRSNALSYLFMLKKDHGIGYALVGDVATVTLPEGCTNPFDTEEEAPKSHATEDVGQEATEAQSDPLDLPEDPEASDSVDDSWLD